MNNDGAQVLDEQFSLHLHFQLVKFIISPRQRYQLTLCLSAFLIEFVSIPPLNGGRQNKEGVNNLSSSSSLYLNCNFCLSICSIPSIWRPQSYSEPILSHLSRAISLSLLTFTPKLKAPTFYCSLIDVSYKNLVIFSLETFTLHFFSSWREVHFLTFAHIHTCVLYFVYVSCL